MNRRCCLYVLLVFFHAAIADDKVMLSGQDWRDTGHYDPVKHGPPGSPVLPVPDGPAFSVETDRGHLHVMHGSELVNSKHVDIPVRGVASIALSPDSKTLYVGSLSDWAVWSFKLGRNGMPNKGRRLAQLTLPKGVDRLAVHALTTDAAGRIYAATRQGIQVFSNEGRSLEVLTLPAEGEIHGLTWRGDKRDMLTAFGNWKGGAVFERQLNAKGSE